MKDFDYTTLKSLKITPAMTKMISQISELRVKTATTDSHSNQSVLDRLVEVAKIQSTDASNRIEGIHTSDTRLAKIMAKKTMPHNRDEEEISGYRDVLDLIHQQYAYIPITPSTILTLHKHLFSFTPNAWGGSFKDIDNQIITTYEDGHEEVRFTPPAAYLTPDLMKELCDRFSRARQVDEIPELILCAAFMFDFVSIHPFRDGNGRMSRLLMLLTLYQAGYSVGKYISLESLIANLKSQYYDSLQASSQYWAENHNDYAPFITYFLSIILQAYRELNDRMHPVEPAKKADASTLIINALKAELRPLSKRELMALVPNYGQSTIEHTLLALNKSQTIKKIGVGRSTKYVLVFEVDSHGH